MMMMMILIMIGNLVVDNSYTKKMRRDLVMDV